MASVPDYQLPASAIAQVPAEPRDSARLLVDRGPGEGPAHRRVAELPELVGDGDLIVVNETRVVPARLRARKTTGASVEVLLLEDRGGWWDALVRPSRRVQPGTVLDVAPELAVEVGERLPGGRRQVRLLGPDPASALDRHGELALPPYIQGGLADAGRYQTVYARAAGSVAAPTAGLHLTPRVLEGCRAAGATVAAVDLTVGLDTFRPITTDRVEDHPMHSERYCVPAEVMEACEAAQRVLAVGTTTVRALESAAASGELHGRTSLMIRPGHRWRVVDALLTNFHQPRSTLLLLLEAMVGGRWRSLYDEALASGYRFLSFGDAMLVARAGTGSPAR